ncbi:MAG: hypothetical protein PHU61_01105 [Candidatus Absconditabacteria bacterium]|nr:hypothetical protein [Candidatus Absconditabacteria bacterium]MDD3868103.1 hypothetical protein [Candidatus Absconditabacteria bacterium]MDD4714351.1 hypothetical protein [Candidatus Absconditabacteria bacterium]
MKIAVVGKGGSGKSSISRLLTQYLLQEKQKVCAIDSDHNMDFTDLLGYEFNEESPSFRDLYDELFVFLDKDRRETKPKELIRENLGYSRFFLDTPDDFTKKVMIQQGENFKLATLALGTEDVMLGNSCAHGLSNPLKIYLSLLDEGKYTVVVDGVAGVDMINFGLYHACDYLIIVVEPSRNGIKVAKQIKNLCDISSVNYGLIVNKYQPNAYADQIYEEMGDKVIGSIAYDEGLFAYDYEKIAETVKKSIANIYMEMQIFKGFSLIERIRKLEELKGN